MNHKQTFKSEISEGDIWSPKKKKNGAQNQSYLNLTFASPNDIVFSYASGEIKAVGVVMKTFVDSPKPESFGSAGKAWDDMGWLVPINWVLLQSPVKPKDFLEKIGPLLPIKNSPLQQNGNGNQSIYLSNLSSELGILLLNLIIHNNRLAVLELEEDSSEIEDRKEIDNIVTQPISPTKKNALIEARIGQGVFKRNVEKIENKCRVTGIAYKEFLVASHIKPWKDSTDEEKLDGNNGFLLSPHVDRLFDRGFISFSENGQILSSHSTVTTIMSSWFIDINKNVGKFNMNQLKYLEYHRKMIFEYRKRFM